MDLRFLRGVLHPSEHTHFFARFRRLATLHLVNLTNFEPLLTVLPRVAPLRSLILQPTMASIPTASLLTKLLHCCPALHITLIAQPKNARDNDNENQQIAVMHAMLKAVIADVPCESRGRLLLRPVGGLD